MFNDFFIGKLLVDVDTGSKLRKVLERKNLLDKDPAIKLMKEILHNIGKTDLATKLDKYLAIG